MGKVFRFNKDVDTDQIIASQYLLYPTVDEMKAQKPGDYVVADSNFGCGSSREQAPAVLKALGVRAVLAPSFARIFYRNSINIGLPAIVCDGLYDAVRTGDEIELDMEKGIVTFGDQTFSCTRLPVHLQKILDQGGLISSLDEM